MSKDIRKYLINRGWKELEAQIRTKDENAGTLSFEIDNCVYDLAGGLTDADNFVRISAIYVKGNGTKYGNAIFGIR